jgi:hypothetical protein
LFPDDLHTPAPTPPQLDEEAKYSGVLRPEDVARMTARPHGAPPPRGAGPNGAAPRAPAAPAWGRAGAGVAAVAGTAPAPPPGRSAPVSVPAPAAGAAAAAGAAGAAGTSPAVRSSPIDISGPLDPRKESNRLRMSIMGAVKKDRASPYGTPKTGLKSPLTSPLIGDPLKVAALNLDPGVSKVCAESGGRRRRGVAIHGSAGEGPVRSGGP